MSILFNLSKDIVLYFNKMFISVSCCVLCNNGTLGSDTNENVSIFLIIFLVIDSTMNVTNVLTL